MNQRIRLKRMNALRLRRRLPTSTLCLFLEEGVRIIEAHQKMMQPWVDQQWLALVEAYKASATSTLPATL